MGEDHLPENEIQATSIFKIPRWKNSEELFRNFKNTLNNHPFSKPLQSVMVEGGATLLNALIEYNLIDAIHQFTGSKEFGLTTSDIGFALSPRTTGRKLRDVILARIACRNGEKGFK